MTLDNLEKKRKRLIFRSWHRGTKEMDLILGGFADAHVPGFDEAQLVQYEALLEQSDPDLYNWIIGKDSAPVNIEHSVFQQLKQFRLGCLSE